MPPRGPDDDEGVIDPDDLDITKSDEVHELRDGQYVIATGDVDAAGGDDVDVEAALHATLDGSVPTSGTDPRSALIERFESVSAANGFVVVGRFDGEVDSHEFTSDDLGTVFGDLLAWYATNVDDDTPTPDVLGILCLAADVQVRYPPRTVIEFLSAHDLSLDDSIRDLFEAVRADGLLLPTDDRERDRDIDTDN